jgi:hypothetical protein
VADRYWVGGTGTWNSTSTTNWAASSGGGTGASVPTAADNVFFDANSNVGTGAFTVTMADSPRVCNDITISGLDGTMTLAGTSIGLTVSGSLSFPATNFTRSYTGTTTFNATTTGKTITTNGVAFAGDVTLNGVGGAWTLGSAFSCGSFTLTLTNGTFDTSTSNYSVTALAFSSNNSNIRTINLNGSTVTLSSSAAAWDMSNSTSATLNAGTSQITCTGSSPDFSGGGLTYYNVSFTSTSATTLAKAILGANTFNNLTVSTLSTAGLNRISFSANQTINGTLTATGSSGNRRMFLSSNTIGTTRTLTCAAIAAMTDVDFRDITIAGAHGTLSGTRLGDCNGNSNITFGAGVNKYWNLAAGGNWSATAWATSSGGTPAATNFPLAQDTVIIENTGLTAGNTITIDASWNIGALDTSTRTNAMTLASGFTNPAFYGNFTYGSGVTPTGTGTYNFFNRSTKTLNSGGKTFTQNVTIDAPGGGIQLITNNLTVDTADTTTLTQGTLDLNNLTLTTGSFSSINSNTRSIAFGTGNISCSGTGSVWGNSTVTGFTTTGTQVVNITSSGSTAITVTNGILSEANSISFNFTGGTYPLTFFQISGNTARNVNFTGYAGTLLATGPTTIYGNLTLSTGMSLTASSSTMTFASTSGTKTITSNGKTMDFPITFNGIGGTWQLQDNMTVGSTRTTTLTNGSIDLFNNTLRTGLFSSAVTNTRSIAFGTGQIALTGNAATVLSVTATNLTSTGTPYWNSTYTGATGTRSFSTTATEAQANSLFNVATSGISGIVIGTAATDAVAITGSFGNVTLTGFTNTLLNTARTIFGNLTLPTGGNLTAGTSTTTFASTSGTETITSNGKTMDFPVTFDGVGGTWQLQDAMTLGATRTCTLTNGTIDLFNNTLSTGIFSSTNSNTRSIAFGTGGITVTTTASGSTVLSMATAINFTFTGTSNISAAMSVTRGFEFGSTSGATTSNRLNINLTSGASPPTFIGSFRQINFTGSTSNPGTQTISCHGFTLASGGTYTSTSFTTVGTGTLTSNGDVIDTLTVNGAGITTTLQDALTTRTGSSSATCTLTQGTLDLNGFTLTTSILSSSTSNTRAIAFGTTGSIVLAASAGQTNLSMATTTNFTFTGTSNISAGMSVTRTFNFGSSSGATASNRLNINLTSGASVPSFVGSFRQINFTGSTSNPGNQIISCHGFTLASGGTYTTTDFTTVGTGTLTYTGKAIDILNINTAGITTTLADAGQNVTTTLTNGTLNLAGFTLTNTTSAATSTGTKNLTFNGGTLVCSAASATAWNNAAPTGFTTTAGTGTGTISMTAATAKTFVGGGSTYNCTLNQGGVGTLTITGANTFNDIANTNATASQITFPASTTTTVNAFTLSGSSGNLVSIRSSSLGTRFTLSKSSGTVNVSYLDIRDSNATGGATWRALATNGNVDSGNNLGWLFVAGNYVDASADVTADATVTGSALRVRLFAGDVSAAAAISAIAFRARLFSGDISANASVEGQAVRVRVASGDITGNAIITGIGNITAGGAANISGFAEVSAYGSATYSFNALVTANADVIANGQIIGEEWGDAATTSSTWTDTTPASSTWQPASQSSNTWLRQ